MDKRLDKSVSRKRRQLINLVPVVLLLTLSECSGDSASEPGGAVDGGDQAGESKIIGGTDAVPHEFPFQLALVLLDKEQQKVFCGATLIDPSGKYALTAAHCVDKEALKASGIDPPNVSVLLYAGFHELPTTIETRQSGGPSVGQLRHVKKVFQHPDFKPLNSSMENDLAVLEVEHPFDMSRNDTIGSIELPPSEYPHAGDFIVMGWGRTSNTPVPGIGISRTLKKATLPAVGPGPCAAAFAGRQQNVTDPQTGEIKEVPFSSVSATSMICAGGQGMDLCEGDLGGVLIQDPGAGGVTTERILVGISSWGNGQYRCGEQGVPGVYTRVSYYRLWIDDRLAGIPLFGSATVLQFELLDVFRTVLAGLLCCSGALYSLAWI